MEKDFWLDEYLKMGTLVGMAECGSGRECSERNFNILKKIISEMADLYQKAIKEGDGHARFK